MQSQSSNSIPFIMIIDDNEMDIMILKHFLKKVIAGGRFMEFTYPEKALSFLQQADQSKDGENIPDIIFLDLNMPVMNGFEFMEAFGDLSEPARNKTRFIITSSSDEPEDIQRAYQFTSVQNYLLKPVQEVELLKCSLPGSLQKC